MKVNPMSLEMVVHYMVIQTLIKSGAFLLPPPFQPVTSRLPLLFGYLLSLKYPLFFLLINLNLHYIIIKLTAKLNKSLCAPGPGLPYCYTSIKFLLIFEQKTKC